LGISPKRHLLGVLAILASLQTKHQLLGGVEFGLLHGGKSALLTTTHAVVDGVGESDVAIDTLVALGSDSVGKGADEVAQTIVFRGGNFLCFLGLTIGIEPSGNTNDGSTNADTKTGNADTTRAARLHATDLELLIRGQPVVIHFF